MWGPVGGLEAEGGGEISYIFVLSFKGVIILSFFSIENFIKSLKE